MVKRYGVPGGEGLNGAQMRYYRTLLADPSYRPVHATRLATREALIRKKAIQPMARIDRPLYSEEELERSRQKLEPRS